MSTHQYASHIELEWTIAGKPAVLEGSPATNSPRLSNLQRNAFINDCLLVGKGALIAWLIGSGIYHATAPLTSCGGPAVLTTDTVDRYVALAQGGAAILGVRELLNSLGRSRSISNQIAAIALPALRDVALFEL